MRAFIDGGARGNPGPAGYGVRIENEDGELVAELRGALGTATNNVAEYHGLIAALSWMVERGHRDADIRSDSELLVKQMRGEYKIKNEGLKPLAARARLLMLELGHVDLRHVRREANQEADRLANLAMDEAEREGRRENAD
jgi:ribonuclease HI